MLDDVAIAIGRVLNLFLKRDAKLPIHMVAIAPNGTMGYARYVGGDEDGLACEILSEPSGTFVVPINLMFVDATGHEMHAVMGHDGTPKVLH